MKKLIKKLIKKWFKLFSVKDLENAMANIDKAEDREDYEWKLKRNLIRR